MAGQKAQPARDAAILTTGEVAAARLSLSNPHESEFLVDLSFTLGSLTNVVLRFYVSADGSTWSAIGDIAGNVSYTLTADTERCFMIKAPGVTFFRASVQGTGTVTSSSARILYRYNTKGSQF